MNMITSPNKTITSDDTRVQLFKPLGHPTRLAILELLRDGEHCVCHMEAYLGLRQAAISQQLSILRDAGMVLDRRDGWNIFYRLSDISILKLLDEAAALTGLTNLEPAAPSVDCCCPHCASKSKNLSN